MVRTIQSKKLPCEKVQVLEDAFQFAKFARAFNSSTFDDQTV
jgi:hypothetical protein